jgi:hypothetical protein
MIRMKFWASICVVLAALSFARAQNRNEIVTVQSAKAKPQQFLLLPYETPEVLAQRQGTNAGAYWKSWADWTSNLQKAGVIDAGGALQNPETAKTLRAGGPRKGSFTRQPEQMSGFLVLRVATLEDAEKWARDCPAVKNGGVVEIRPMVPMMAGAMAEVSGSK